jgi:NitT/TauT family transport system permease protein
VAVLRRSTAPILFGLLLLVLWALIAGAVPPYVLPGPVRVLQRLGLELSEGGLLGFAGSTVGVALIGCLLALVVSLPLAYVLSHFRTVAAAINPWIAASQAIPAVAIAPLLVIWFGYGTLPTALLCTLMVFFPIVVASTLGFTRIDPDLTGAATVDGANARQLLVWIEFPLALPAVLAGIRTGFVVSITGAVVGEFIMGGTGIGQLLSTYRASADTTGMIAVLLALVVLAVAVNGIIRLLERTITW